MIRNDPALPAVTPSIEARQAPVSSVAPVDVRIGLLWHSLTSGNLGIGALTFSNAAIIREAAESLGFRPHLTVLGMKDGETPAVIDDVEDNYILTARSMLSPRGLWRKLGELDCVIDIGAGDSFTDVYGLKRFFILCASKYMAAARRVPLILAPQTIGPFNRSLCRRLAAYALRSATAIVARDPESYDMARTLAPKVPAFRSADVAFGLPYEDQSGLRNGGRLRIGVNVSGLLFHQAETGSNRFGLGYDYAVFTRDLLNRLAARDGVELHLLPHVISPGNPVDDDGRIIDRLSREFPSAVRAPDFRSPVEAKSYISGLDFLVAARMHACIAAFSAGTPVVPVAYSRKFLGLFASLGYDRVLPVVGMDEAQAVEFVLDSIAQRDQLDRPAHDGAAQAATLLDEYREVVRSLIASIMPGHAGRPYTPRAEMNNDLAARLKNDKNA